MSYRRLFHVLFLCSTLSLVVVWGYSLRYDTRVAFVPFGRHGGPSPGGEGSLRGSTISIAWFPSSPWRGVFKVFSTPALHVSKDEEPYFLSGRFHLGWTSTCLLLQFPVWIPYLVVVCGGYLLIRRQERRSTHVLETELAVRQAYPDPSRESYPPSPSP